MGNNPTVMHRARRLLALVLAVVLCATNINIFGYGWTFAADSGDWGDSGGSQGTVTDSEGGKLLDSNLRVTPTLLADGDSYITAVGLAKQDATALEDGDTVTVDALIDVSYTFTVPAKVLASLGGPNAPADANRTFAVVLPPQLALDPANITVSPVPGLTAAAANGSSSKFSVSFDAGFTPPDPAQDLTITVKLSGCKWVKEQLIGESNPASGVKMSFKKTEPGIDYTLKFTFLSGQKPILTLTPSGPNVTLKDGVYVIKRDKGKLEFQMLVSFFVKDGSQLADFSVALPKELKPITDKFKILDQDNGGKVLADVVWTLESDKGTITATIPNKGDYINRTNINGWVRLACNLELPAGNNSGTFPVVPAPTGNVETPKFMLGYEPLKREPTLVKSQAPCGCGDKSCYRWVTTIKPGNTVTTGAASLTDGWNDMTLQAPNGSHHDVKFGGKVISAGAAAGAYTVNGATGISCIVSTAAENNGLLSLSDPNGENELTEYVFSYSAKVNSKVYLQDGETTIKNTGKLTQDKGDGNGAVTVTPPGEQSATVPITPKPVKIEWVYHEDKQLVSWTVTLNGDELNMYNPEFLVMLGWTGEGQQESYLTGFTNINVDGTSLNKFDATGETWPKYTHQYSGLGTGASPDRLLNNVATITFDTPVDPSFYMTQQKDYIFKVSVALQWDEKDANGNTIGTHTKEAWEDKLSKPVTRSALKKEAVSYDPATGIVTWKLEVTPGKAPLSGVKITDVIAAPQTFLKLTSDSAGNTPISTASSHSTHYSYDAGTKTLTINVDTVAASTPAVFYLHTTLDDGWRYNNTDKQSISNGASISATTGLTAPHQASDKEDVPSKLLSKTKGSIDYDISTRRATWKIDVNTDKTALEQVVLTDTLNHKPGTTPRHKLVAGTLKIVEAGQSANVLDPAKLTTTDGGFTYDFGDISKHYVVTFETEVFNIDDLNGLISFDLDNKADLQFKVRGAAYTNTVEAVQKAKTTPVTKEGKVDNNDGGRADYTVELNKDFAPLVTASVTDTFSCDKADIGLVLDPSTMLIQVFDRANTTATPTKTYTAKDISQNNWLVYDQYNKTFTLTLPTGAHTNGAFGSRYVLKYSIFPVNAHDKFTVTNAVKVNLNGAETSAAKPLEFNTPSGGGGSSTTHGRVAVIKKDDAGNPLSGIAFGIYLDDILAETIITGLDGKAVSQFLRPINTPYTIKEMETPAKYMPNTESFSGVIQKESAKGQAAAANTHTFTNVRRGTLKIVKTDDATPALPLANVEFKLYKGAVSDANFVQTLTTNAQGVALSTKHLDNGVVYTLRETKTPTGYMSAADQTFTPQAGKQIELTIVNDRRGSLTIRKQSEQGRPIADVRFVLHDASGVPVARAVTDTDGIAVVPNLENGATYTVIETSVPDDYMLDTTPQTITIKAPKTGEENVLRFVNREKGTWVIVTVDKSPEPKPLEGAKIGLFLNGEKIAEAVTDAEGRVTFPQLPLDQTYTVKELEPPRGYSPNPDELTYRPVDAAMRVDYLPHGLVPSSGGGGEDTPPPAPNPAAPSGGVPGSSPDKPAPMPELPPVNPGQVVTGSFSKSPGSTLAVEHPPQNGTVTILPDGSWTYIPNEGFEGEDVVLFKYIDSNNETRWYEVKVRVLGQYKRDPRLNPATGATTPEASVQRHWLTAPMLAPDMLRRKENAQNERED